MISTVPPKRTYTGQYQPVLVYVNMCTFKKAIHSCYYKRRKKDEVNEIHSSLILLSMQQK